MLSDRSFIMKIGTLSLNINTDDLNYGAMLHSWAFQQVLKKLEVTESTEIINYTTDMLADFNGEYPVLSYLKMKRIRSAIKLVLSGSSYKKRYAKFKDFTKKHMCVSDIHYNRKKLESSALPYDCLICESDVIWSPKFFNDNLDPVFFLSFPSAKKLKRIIYSASMANADFNDQTTEKLKKYLKAPQYISCRESFACDIVKKVSGRKAEHVLDPVMLLEEKDYLSICSDRLINEPYLLLYIPLGYNSDYQKTAEKYAKAHGIKVVELSYFTWQNHNHTVIADAGIEDFLSLIKNAEVVFTNSFHAVCFSLLFHVDFYAFSRKTGRKTEDFCQWLGISDRHMNINDFNEKPPIDYPALDSVISEKRNLSINWLKKTLEQVSN